MSQRARILIQLKRFDQAAHLLEQHLAGNPHDAEALGCLAICRSEEGKHDVAADLAGQAIAVAPDEPWCHYVMARVLYQRNRLEEARQSVQQAIRLEPEDPDLFALLGDIYLQQKKWQKALTATRAGRRFDPDHIQCTNIQAAALTQLGRLREAQRALRDTLRRDPEDARSHANQGWTLIQQGRYGKALLLFREALRLEPEMAWAQEGIKEALKAGHPIYRVLLRYKLLMTRLRARWQLAILLGGYAVFRVALWLAESRPSLAPFCWLVAGLYLGFVVLTWFGDPIFNMLLRFNQFGRHALTRAERLESSVITPVLLGGILSALYGVIMKAGFAVDLGLMIALICAPLRFAFVRGQQSARRGMCAFVAVVALLGLVVGVDGWRLYRDESVINATISEVRAVQREIDQFEEFRVRFLQQVGGREGLAELMDRLVTAGLADLLDSNADEWEKTAALFGEEFETSDSEVALRRIEELLKRLVEQDSEDADECAALLSFFQRRRALQDRKEAVESSLEAEPYRSLRDEYDRREGRYGTLMLIYAALCVWVSQIVAVWLEANASRR